MAANPSDDAGDAGDAPAGEDGGAAGGDAASGGAGDAGATGGADGGAPTDDAGGTGDGDNGETGGTGDGGSGGDGGADGDGGGAKPASGQQDAGGGADSSSRLKGDVHDDTDGGWGGGHVLPEFGAARVAPTHRTDPNRLTLPLTPIACWRVEDVRFRFDSSFVAPAVATEVAILARLRQRYTRAGEDGTPVAPRMSIFGHADPVGDDEYNKQLAGRRGLSVYALFTRDAAIWEKLYSTRIDGSGDVWGLGAVQTMLRTLGYDPGAADGQGGPHTQDAIRAFQGDHGQAADGQAGPATRQPMYLAYMDKLCGTFRLDKALDFLAGTDGDGKGDVQGCSEFNPVLIFSNAESQAFAASGDKAERDKQNAPNRRVMALLFPAGQRVQADKWPCPKALEPTGGCRKRFWSDGEARRSAGEVRKVLEATPTFACRFYDRLAGDSPCERPKPPFDLRIWLFDRLGQRMPVDTPYHLQIGGQERTGALKQEGLLIELNVHRTGDPCKVDWARDPDFGKRKWTSDGRDILKDLMLQEAPAHPFYVDPNDGQDPNQAYMYHAVLDIDTNEASLDDQPTVRTRLINMGYPRQHPVEGNIELFQTDYQLSPGDTAATYAKLREAHRAGEPADPAPDPGPEVPELDEAGDPYVSCEHIDPDNPPEPDQTVTYAQTTNDAASDNTASGDATTPSAAADQTG